MKRSSSLIRAIDGRDYQRTRVFSANTSTINTTKITPSCPEDWKEFPGEGAVDERVEMNFLLHVMKGDQTLLIIHENPQCLDIFCFIEEDVALRVSKNPVIVRVYR